MAKVRARENRRCQAALRTKVGPLWRDRWRWDCSTLFSSSVELHHWTESSREFVPVAIAFNLAPSTFAFCAAAIHSSRTLSR